MASAHVQTMPSAHTMPSSNNPRPDDIPSTAVPVPPPQPRVHSMLDVGGSSPPKNTSLENVANGQNGTMTSVTPPRDSADPSIASNTSSKNAAPGRFGPQPGARPVSASNTTSLITAGMASYTPRSVPAEKQTSTNKNISKKDGNGSDDAAVHASPSRPRGIGRVKSFLQRKHSNHQSRPHDVAADRVDPKESTVSSSPGKPTYTFSFSSRSSGTSPSASPPSPGSPSSTLNETEAESLPDENMLSKRHSHHSSSTNNLARGAGIRVGITWGPSVGGRPVDQARQRSASTEHVPSLKKGPGMGGIAEEEELRLKLHHAFSRDAGEGAGLKARRLSTCLPDEFWVDYCELDNEFKSSTLLPGRRGKLLGKGATSVVRLMCRKGESSGVFYAVKEFRGKERDENDDDYIKKVKSEYSIAKSLHHPNIVETVRLCTHGGKWNHVMEYCQYGELYSLVEKGLFKNGAFKQSDKLCFFKQLVRGVDYLHSHGVAHRDIKLENLLLSSEGYLKITDFGVSEVFSGEHPGLRSAGGQCGKNMGEVRRCAPGICGSLPYIAPEVLEKKGDYDPRPLDVWSCAIVYLTMTFGGSPWAAAKTDGNPYYAKFKEGWDAWLADNPDGIINDTAGGVPHCGPMFSPQWLGSAAIKRLMLRMLHPIPEKRISIHDVLTSACVRSIECCAPESYEDSTCCIDASKSGCTLGKKTIKRVKHDHIPPREHKTPKLLQHRFDMGDGWN